MLRDVQVSQLQDAIDSARSHFIESLDDRILELDALVTHCRSTDDPYPAFGAIARSAHKIAGLAPTLGLESLGSCARNTEIAAAEISSDPSRGDSMTVLNMVEELLDQMEEAVTC